MVNIFVCALLATGVQSKPESEFARLIHRGPSRLMLDLREEAPVLKDRSVREHAVIWDLDLVEIPGGYLMVQPDLARRHEQIAKTFSEVFANLNQDTLAKMRKGEMVKIQEIGLTSDQREFVARLSGSSTAPSVLAGEALVFFGPLVTVEAKDKEGNKRRLRAPTVGGEDRAGRQRPWWVGVPTATGLKENKFDPLPDSERRPVTDRVEPVTGSLDFGVGRFFTVPEIAERAQKVWGRVFLVDKRLTEHKVFVRGKWEPAVFAPAFKRLTTVRGVEPASESTSISDAFWSRFASAARLGTQSGTAASAFVPGLEDWLREIGAGSGSLVQVRPAVRFMVCGGTQETKAGPTVNQSSVIIR